MLKSQRIHGGLVPKVSDEVNVKPESCKTTVQTDVAVPASIQSQNL
jgi:hypothetical protein